MYQPFSRSFGDFPKITAGVGGFPNITPQVPGPATDGATLNAATTPIPAPPGPTPVVSQTPAPLPVAAPAPAMATTNVAPVSAPVTPPQPVAVKPDYNRAPHPVPTGGPATPPIPPPPPPQTVPNAGSLPAQVADATATQNQLLTNPGGGASNPYLNLGVGAVQGMNQLSPQAQMLQNQLFGQAFNTGGNPTIMQALNATNQSYTQSPFSEDYLNTLFRGDAASQPGVSGSLDAVNRQVNRQLSEQTIPGVQDEAIGAGQFGSSRQGVSEGIARRGAQDTIADTTARITMQAAEQQRAQQQQVMDTMMGLSQGQNLQSGNILSNAFGTGLGAAGGALQGQRGANIAQGTAGGDLAGQAFGTTIDAQIKALGLAPSIGQFGMMPSQLVGDVGDAQQQHQQALIDEALARFYQYQGSNNANIQEYLANLGVISPLSGTQSTGANSGIGKGASALGGAATGAYIGSQAGNTLGPYGTLIGAGVGAVGGYLAGG